MTTIAYKDQIIAYDSRSVSGDVIVDDCFIKKTKVKGVVFFVVGNPSDLEEFQEMYFGETGSEKLGCDALVVDEGIVYVCGVEKGKIWKDKVDKPTTLGSGAQFALAAMDCGCTAVEAVKVAAKRDIYTGGRIRKYIIGG